MVTGKPALRDAVTPLVYVNAALAVLWLGKGRREGTYILDNVAVVTDEEEGAAFLHVDLHANQSWCM